MFLSPLRRPPPISRRLRRHGRCCQASFARAAAGAFGVIAPGPFDPIEIVANTLAHPADTKALMRSVELCHELGNSAAMSPMPANLAGGRS